MSAKPAQPVGDDGKPIGLANYANATEPVEEEDVLGHVANAIPTEDGNDPMPRVAN